jgi:hypothetical protein
MDMSRREMLTDVLAGATVAVVGLTAIDWVVAPKCAEAAPAGIARPVGAEADELIEKAQVVVVPGRRRRCWWRRGRRICRW